ncbi:MAG: hypothetical protein TV42_02190 [Wolbachia endosymbiont of Dactylopius coccus]|nr:MAG: hypothetical protein TV42_02190 [Wolbachia endosymbiont of Dactylopius coccus]
MAFLPLLSICLPCNGNWYNKKKSLSFSGGLSKIRKRLNPKKKKQSNKRLNSSEALPETRRWNLENLVDAIKKFDSETVELIMKRNAIVMHESTKSILQEAINEAKTEIGNLQGEEKNRQGSELKKIEELFKGSLSEIQTNQGKAIEGTFFNAIEDANFEAVKLIMELGGIKATEPILQAALKKANEKYGSGELRKKDKQEIREIIDFLSAKLSEIQNDHVPSINVLNRAELEKARSEKIAAESTELEKVESEAEFERLAAASTELEKAESEAEFEKLAAASTELEKAEFERIVAESAEREKVESEAKFEKLASVQDLYLDHAQPVNANISEEDVNSTTSDQITPVGSDELDSSSGEPLYSTIDSGSSDPQLDGQQSPQSEILTNTLDDDVSSLSSDEHSSASSNAGDTSTTENVIDNEEEPVVDDKDDQPAGKEGDSKSPVTFIIEGDDNKVVFEQDNSVKTHPQNAKLPVIATWTSAITGVLTGAAAPVAYFAFSASLLVAGIIAGVGACCLVAAVVIYCCTPKSQVENNEVEKPFNMKEELTVTSV